MEKETRITRLTSIFFFELVGLVKEPGIRDPSAAENVGFTYMLV